MNPTILTMGLNHTTAPVQVREQVASAPCVRDDTLDRMQIIQKTASISESLILSTCNRTEIYVVTTDLTASQSVVRSLFAGNETFAGIADYLYTYTDRLAIEHLFAVASGIDSMVLGEFEILGQVRNAYISAAERQSVGPVLHHLFNEAIHVGKRSHSETNIGAGAISVAYAAVSLARQRTGALTGKHVLVAGAGETAHRVAKCLVEENTSTVVVANRTFDHAAALAREIGGQAAHFSELAAELAQADVVISATSAPHIVLTAGMVRSAMEHRHARPLLLVDIAVPRDIEPAAADIENVELYNIDDLRRRVDSNLAIREQAISQVRAIIAEETDKSCQWLAERRAAPVIADLRERAEGIRAIELEKALRRLGHLHLSERDRNVIDALSSGILNRFLATPTEHLKERVQSGDGEVYLCALRELFELAQVNDHESADIPPAV